MVGQDSELILWQVGGVRKGECSLFPIPVLKVPPFSFIPLTMSSWAPKLYQLPPTQFCGLMPPLALSPVTHLPHLHSPMLETETHPHLTQGEALV